MENCWPLDSIFTWESCKLSSILNIECRMPSRPRFAVTSLRTDRCHSLIKWVFFNHWQTVTCWRWDLPALALISLTLSLRVSYARLRVDMIMVMCRIQINDWMISHFQKRILYRSVSPVRGFPMFIGHRDGVTTRSPSWDAMFAELKFTPCYGANHVR